MADSDRRYGWHLEAFVRRLSGDVGAIIVSKRGRCEARSRNADPSTVDRLATRAVQISELADVAGAWCGFGRCRQIVIGMAGDRTLVVIPIGDGAQLAVMASGADLEQLAFESFRLVERLNQM
jgi:predicted regulator of Ras-like GTPase activity (Roadblock/LC7/MglB family)